MKSMKLGALIALTAGLSAACAVAPVDGEDSSADATAPGTIPAAGVPGAPVAGAPVAGAPVAGAPVAGAPVAGAPVPGATTPGATTPGSTTPGDSTTTPTAGGSCAAITTGAQTVEGNWWAGSSVDTLEVAADFKSISSSTGWGTDVDSDWAQISYEFDTNCVDASNATSISVDLSSQAGGNYRVAIQTKTSQPTSNHYKMETTLPAGGAMTTVTLNLSTLEPAWDDGMNTPFDLANVMALIVMPRDQGMTGWAAFDISATNVVVQ
ncbi:MAG: hypothetical protein MK135_08060 [Polyangiaceae bacterium]|nr:hypothetical protein [Polyangiaceae bacterium]